MKKGTSVLVVEDEAGPPGFLSHFLPDAGLPCTTVRTAEAALEILAGRAFDIVLTDVLLPGMDGLELTRKIKRRHPGTAVIALTDHGWQCTFDAVLEAGADDFLRRPFSLAEALARISLARRHLDLRRWAVTDELTGACNRKGFFTLGQHLLKMARRTREELFLLYADLDDLKSINDTHGHPAGDLALQDVATIMRGTFRESDIVARIGGDEFVVFPVGTSRPSQEILMRRFEEALASHNATAGRPYRLALSCGFSSVGPGRPLSLDDLLVEADRAMYGRKHGKKPRPLTAPAGP